MKNLFSIMALSLASGTALASPFLPSQGMLTVQDDCIGTKLTQGQKVQILANQRGVTITNRGETLSLSARGEASGHFCGMASADDMCVIDAKPILKNDALIFNGFSTMGGMSLGDPLHAGFLADADHAVYDLQLFDTGTGIELSGQIFAYDGATSSVFSCALVK